MEIYGPYCVNGIIEVQGDKSISHRSIILSAITKDIVEINNFLFSDDCLNTLNILKNIGVKYQINKNNILMEVVEFRGLAEPEQHTLCR